MTREEYLKALRLYFGLNESVNVADSYEALRGKLESALRAWADVPAEDLDVIFTFADRLVAMRWRPSVDGGPVTYEISWQAAGEGFAFGTPVKVERVTRYENVTTPAQSVSESKDKGERFTELLEQRLTLTEASGDGPRRVRAIGITADVINENGRRYPRAVLAEALSNLNTSFGKSAGQGRLILTGEAEHPGSKGGRANILETVIKWETAALNAEGRVILEGVILPTGKGKDVQVLVENGVQVGISQRGYGKFEAIEENGQPINEVTQLVITGYDLVAEPSDPNASILESRGEPAREQETTMSDEQKAQNEAQVKEQRALRAQLDEAQKLLKEKDAVLVEAQKAETELIERKRQEAIGKAITEATKDLKFGDDMNKLFVESVKAANPADGEAVKTLVEAKRKEYDAMAAAAKLGTMGKKPGGPVIEVASAFEEGTGWPEYAKASWELAESIRRGTMQPARDLLKPKTVNEEFTRLYLAKFDEQYARHLKRENAEFLEATVASDLNLPYSASRAIIAEAFPTLVATSIFDVGLTDTAPTRVYFEATTGESGYTGTVTDEVVVSSDDTWVALDYKRLTPGTVVLTHTSGSPTYTEGTDYVIDYEGGRMMNFSGGAISDAQSLKIDYTYTAIRLGENQPIERAKTTLSYQTLDVMADRLATEITREAIVFSRSQLGWDVTSRTLTNLVRQVRRKIDQGLIYMGLGAALQVVSNSGGTWTAATDPYSELVEKIGVARVKVANRFYEPTFLLVSATNSDKLANWDGFTAAGKRPDADLNANGYVGRLKGLACFESTEMSDAYALVGNRELVAHRIFSAMQIMGPYPSYSSNKLVAADQYYAEEFNGSLAPVPGKGSYVKIA